MDDRFGGRKVSTCLACRRRVETFGGYCQRCRVLGYESTWRDTETKEQMETRLVEETRKREEEKRKAKEPELTEEELSDILQKRTRIYERKRKGEKDFLPESVDANIKRPESI